MNKYAVCLRGINVGGNRTVKMVDLTACFVALGFRNVTTLLRSGNVTFESSDKDLTDLQAKIEKALSARFNYPARVFMYSIDRLKDILSVYPFEERNDDFQYYVVLLRKDMARELAREPHESKTDIEEIAVGKDVVYWKVKKGMSIKSVFSKNLTKAKYKEFHTVRNIKTLRKLVAN